MYLGISISPAQDRTFYGKPQKKYFSVSAIKEGGG